MVSVHCPWVTQYDLFSNVHWSQYNSTHHNTISQYRVLLVLARMALCGTLLVLTGIWLATATNTNDEVQGKGTITLIIINKISSRQAMTKKSIIIFYNCSKRRLMAPN